MTLKHFLQPVVVCVGLALAGCGGGGGGDDAGAGNVSSAPVAVPSLRGVAATGAPINNATVTVVDALGTRTYSTDENGQFSIALSQVKAPALLKVTLMDGRYLLSMWDGGMQGSSATANITPLTDAVLTLYAQKTGLDVNALTPDQLNQPAVLAQAKGTVSQWVGEGLRAAGLSPSGTDLLSAPFQANGAGLDAVLDSIHFERNTAGETVLYPKQLLLSADQAPTVAQPLSASAPLTGIAAGQNLLSTAMLNQWRTRMNACMQLAVDQRAASSSCAGLYPTRYKNDGVNFQTQFFAETGEQSSVGAVFDTPNILSLSSDATGTQAIVELRWFQPSTGSSHSRMSVFKDLGTAGRLQDNQVASATGSSWWLWGNQNAWEVRIEPRVTRYENLNASSQSDAPSHVRYGLHILVNTSTQQNGQWVDAGLVAAKVTGAGLPDAGLVLAPVDKSRFDSGYLAILNAQGAVPSAQNPSAAASDVNEYSLAAQPINTDASETVNAWWSGLSASNVSQRPTMLKDFSSLVRQTPYAVQLYFKDGSTQSLQVRLTGTLKSLQDKQVAWPTFLDMPSLASQMQTNTSVVNLQWSAAHSNLRPESSFLFAAAPALPNCNVAQRWALQSPANSNTPAASFQATANNCRLGVFPGGSGGAVINVGLKALQDGVRYYSVLGWQSAAQ